jgi:hypothetical protein
MSDTTSTKGAPKSGEPAKRSFAGNSSAYTGKPLDFGTLKPLQEPDPEIAQGIDLAGKPKVIFAVGRGRTGKTTFLRWISEISIDRGSSVILADIDPSNATFSTYFGNVARPETDAPAGIVRWLQSLIEHCMAERQSAIVDLGGGDTTLRTLATELPSLAETMEIEGIAPVVFHLLTTNPEDLTPALTLSERGFSPPAQALVLNEFGIEAGRTRAESFRRIFQQPGFQTLAQTSVVLWMPRLFSAEAIEARQCKFQMARDGRVTPG